jgi:hypothetical protein
LSELRYPTPKEYKDRKFSKKGGMDVEPKCIWTARMVHDILNNEQYTGTYVSGKKERKILGGSRLCKDRSEWIVIHNSHTPIVSKETFGQVQEILQNRKYTIVKKPPAGAWKKQVPTEQRQRLIDGELKISIAPYGFKKKSMTELEIDAPAANVVQEIFEMILDGVSASEICRKLNDIKCPTPKEYYQISRGKNVKPSCDWIPQRVRSILENEKYTGSYVAGKMVKDYETGKKYHTHKSEWVVIPGKYPAIISQADFDKAQEILSINKQMNNKNRAKAASKDPLLYGNIVKCGCCGYALVYNNSRAKDKHVYYCHHTLSDPSAECYKMKASAKEIHSAVLSIIRKHAKLLLNTSDISNLQKSNISTPQLAEYEKQYRQLNGKRQKYYEQFVEGDISREDYLTHKSHLSGQIEKLERQFAQFRRNEQTIRQTEKSSALAKDVLGGALSEREVVELLIDKVKVFPNHDLEIIWKISDFAMEV